VDARVHCQQHPHYGLRPRVVDRQRLFTRQHAHNARRKPGIRG
jgi:lipopolysaccharide/colanic/teichoic acid biosynthesis glycosyltransferase